MVSAVGTVMQQRDWVVQMLDTELSHFLLIIWVLYLFVPKTNLILLKPILIGVAKELGQPRGILI